MLRLRDIMTTDVLTLVPELTLRGAMDALTARGVSGAPVVDRGRVVGVLSASDLLAFAATHAELEPETHLPEESEEELPWDDDEVEAEGDDQALYFAEMLSDSDRPVDDRMDDARGTPRRALDEHTVAEIMTRELHAMRPEDEVTAAADYMRSSKIHRLLVLEEQGLAGIVTTMDIARAVADGRLVRTRYVFPRGSGESPRRKR